MADKEEVLTPVAQAPLDSGPARTSENLRPVFTRPGWSDKSDEQPGMETGIYFKPVAAMAVFIFAVSVLWYGISWLIGTRRVTSSKTSITGSGTVRNPAVSGLQPVRPGLGGSGARVAIVYTESGPYGETVESLNPQSGNFDSVCAPFDGPGHESPEVPASGRASAGLGDASEQVEYIVDYLLSSLASSGDRVETLSRESRTFGGSRWKWVEKKLWTLEPDRMIRRLCSFFEKSSFQLLGRTEGLVPGSTVLSIGFNGKSMLELSVAPRNSRQSLAAIIIDDVGYGGKAGEEIMKMPPVLTLSILPGERLSLATAELARKNGFEVMLHQPMEGSSTSIRLGPGGLVTTMSDDEILRRFRTNLDEVSGAAGVNNHMGSVFTANRSRMRVVLEEIRRRKLFFIDSRTSVETVAEEEAADLGVPAWRRHVFLDNDVDSTAISRQIMVLIEAARKEGGAIGIGHAHVGTIKAIRAMLPEFEKSGVRLVHVGELLKARGLSYPDGVISSGVSIAEPNEGE